MATELSEYSYAQDRQAKLNRRDRRIQPFAFMIPSICMAFVAIRIMDGAESAILATIMISVFVVQAWGIVAGWNTVPTGKSRIVVCSAFLAASLAVIGLIIAAFVTAAVALIPLHFYLLFGLWLQGYWHLWHGGSRTPRQTR
ncbi:hypothetical protein ACIBCN_39760 [Nocardia sp. NPDC051052]|uniref:hypothetical protein n=1 Tax=Nocardia sp. NPDC051052 TaxID=3364322 RepID=UPI0037A360F4